MGSVAVVSVAARLAVVLIGVAALGGCAGEARLPQCRGAWLPVNAPVSGEAPAERMTPEQESVDGTA